MELNLAKTGEDRSGLRKLLQDVVAPEHGSIQATFAAVHDGQQQMRQERKNGFAQARKG